jgi:CBS domain-containing protein
MDEQPRSPGVEFFMAAAGPLSSIALGFVFYGVSALLIGFQSPAMLVGVAGYLAYINFILAAFNLVPAFPLDGGRILRSALWKWKGNIRWATRIASSIGSGFGVFLIVVGIWDVFRGNPVGGIWLFLIGMFIRGASQISYRQVLMQKILEGEKVGRFLNKDPVSVPVSASVRQLLEEYFYRYHFKMFPVMEEEKLRGCVSMSRVRDIPPEQRDTVRVEELVQQCTPENTIPLETDAMRALKLMDKAGNDKLMVVQDGRLQGVVTRNDILRFLAAKMDFGELERKS